ncbi:ABC transporter ATP-binding protein [Pelagibacterium xiamenense]|uniref:ABC transporter ATP-binding protein n=1 Tax=Pelagibacterium xiamenense TaxID=2901140 RepID=UPI001E4F1B6A|nr:ABC transporter ATP-binding protein [Pelagibacterium xiamenense]MCD7059393.1 ABC transporter ATP-binding protein [Pelagibacterium xiamenense]
MDLAQQLVGARPARLDARGLSWGPAGGAPIITDINVSVAAGEMLAVVGPNGAGKSSLLRCLYRFHRPTAGTVRLDGDDIWAVRPRALARRVATVLQESASDFGLTVAEIVELGLTPHVGRFSTPSYRPIETALALMNLTDFAARNFASLSGGEKQRVMIARALVQKPDLIILDEPTNHLDIRHQLEVLDLLSRLPTTVIVSLHDLALASAHADRVLVLEDGKQIQLGQPLDVLTPETVRRTFAVEAAIDSHPSTGRPRFSFHLDRNA